MSPLPTQLHRPSLRRNPRALASTSSALFQPDLPSLTPEQALWFEVLRRLYSDIAQGGGQRAGQLRAQGHSPNPASSGARVQLTQEDECRLDFVAMAVGLPSDTLSRLVRAGEREYETRERARER